jgi:two-component system, cell cycle response regulator
MARLSLPVDSGEFPVIGESFAPPEAMLVVEGFLARLTPGDAKAVLAAALDAFVELTGEQGVCVVLEPRAQVVATRYPPVPLGSLVDLPAHPELGRCLARGEILCESVGPFVPAAPRTLVPPPGAFITVLPLLAGDRPVGVLWSWARVPRFREEVRSACTILARTAALVYQARLDAGVAPTVALREESAVVERVEPEVTPTWASDRARGDKALRLLLVEDDVDLARHTAEVLNDEGYDVTVVANGQDAVASARRAPPALLLLDVRLPDRDGFSVAVELSGDRRTAGVPILFLSGTDDLSARVRGFREGEADFLHKPYGLEDLLARIEQCLLRADRRNHLRRKARIDDLTGLGNLRLFEERLAIEASRVDRYGTPLSMVVVDVDKLKLINDQHGHRTGSAVLRAIGTALSAETRDTDLAARYGGDEFVVLLPHTSLTDAAVFGERVLNRIRTLRPCGLSVSVSMGIAAFDAALDGAVNRLFERADMASYRAKRQGGNRLAMATRPTPTPEDPEAPTSE